MTRIKRVTIDATVVRWKRLITVGAISMATAIMVRGGYSHAQVVSSSTVAVTQEEMNLVMRGWSAKKQIMGKAVYDEEKQRIGAIDDLIVTPDKSFTYAIVAIGGFLGMGKHDVAIPVNHFKVDKDRITLPGATKNTLKAMPRFVYAKQLTEKGQPVGKAQKLREVLSKY